MSLNPCNRSTVYAIRHNVTGRIYVGTTANLNDRIRSHVAALRSGRHPVELMQKDFDIYGDNLSFFILYDSHGFSGVVSFHIERLFMEILGTRDPSKGYNYKDPTRPFRLSDLREYKITKDHGKILDPRLYRNKRKKP